MIAPAAGAAAAAGASYSMGLCSFLSGIFSALSCAFTAIFACVTGARCCSGGACAGGGGWGAGKVGSMLVVAYAVGLSFLFEYGLEDKLHHLADHAKAWDGTHCKLGKDAYDGECLGQEGIFRINLAVVVFFLSNWLGCKLSKQYHNALWIVKVFVFFGYCCITLFWVPSPFIAGYVWASRAGAALYSIALMVFIIEFAYEVNDWMVDQSGDWGAPTTCGLDDNLIMLLGFSCVLFAAALAGVVCLFVFFPASNNCEAGQAITAFISMTLVFCVATTATQLVFSESGNLLTSSAVCAYGTYLAYSAIAKHPSEECNPLWGHDNAATTWISLILAFISLIWMSKTAGDVGRTIDAELGVELVPSDDEEKNNDDGDAPPPPIDCLDGGDRAGATFNLIMSLASCYVACTIANWGAGTGGYDEDAAKPLAGRASMWMQIAAQWSMFFLYEWTLVAPLVFPDRDWV